MADPFIAEIRIFAGNFAPRGWAFCDGQLLPIAQNSALFSLLGTTYGGDGRSTVGLPDLRERAPMHPGRGPGLMTPRKLGERGGAPTVTLSAAQMPAHRHAVRATVNAATATNPQGQLLAAPTEPAYAPRADSADLTEMAVELLDAVDGSQAHPNMQPYLELNYIIALVGTEPSES